MLDMAVPMRSWIERSFRKSSKNQSRLPRRPSCPILQSRLVPDEVERFFLEVDHDRQRELLVVDGFVDFICKAHDVVLTASSSSESELELVVQTVVFHPPS